METEEGLEASRKPPTSTEDTIEAYLREEVIQHGMHLIKNPKKQNKRLGKDWYLDLIY